MDLSGKDVQQFAEADRREVDPPIQVEAASWSPGGRLDWWVKERQEWWGRVRGADGRQRWIRAGDLRPASGSQPWLGVRPQANGLTHPRGSAAEMASA
jgi:hypothetical protein